MKHLSLNQLADIVVTKRRKRLISGCTPEKCIPDLMLEIRNASVLLYFTLHSSFTLSFQGASFSNSSSDISLLGLCSNRKFRYLYKSRL